ncbi:hypothetical protein JAB1_46600 [Janthinobacterium sp. MP5059B]|nr:hypothetical protein JAB1_46600 [Janthinobacterium sp. MP5059B]
MQKAKPLTLPSIQKWHVFRNSFDAFLLDEFSLKCGKVPIPQVRN